MTNTVSKITCSELSLQTKTLFQGSFQFYALPSHNPILFGNLIRRAILSEVAQLSLRLGICGNCVSDFSNHNTLIDFVYSSFFSSKRFSLRQKSLGELGFNAGIDLQQLTNRMNHLSLFYAKKGELFKNTFVRLNVRGPGQIRAAHLHFPPGITCINPNVILGELSDESVLEIYFLLQISSTALSSWNAYHIGYKSLTTGQNRSKGYLALQFIGENLCEPETFPIDTRKPFYKGINFSYQKDQPPKLVFTNALNSDVNHRLYETIVRFERTLQKLQAQVKRASPLIATKN